MKTVLMLVAAVGLAATAGLVLEPEAPKPPEYAKAFDQEPGQLPPGHPPVSDASVSAGSARPPHPALVTDVPVVTVPRATGDNAKTIAELYAAKGGLSGQRVRVRGQVVKVTAAVLGKNYLRLRDGSSQEPSQRELVVTSQLEAKRGDVILLEGTLRTDVDVGIGIVYPVLLEDARAATDK